MAGIEYKKTKDLGLFRPHLLELASNLNRLRSQDSLTDVTVTIGNRHFRAHRAVLAACSSYFQAMFTSGFQESNSSDVVIEEGTSVVLEELLDFAYTGIVNFSKENIVDVLTMESYLQMKSAVDACTEFLRERMMDSEDADVAWGDGIVFQVYLIAEHHEMVELKDLCWQFIIDDFIPLSKTDGFRTCVTAELLTNLLERSDLTKPTHQKLPWHLKMSEMLGIIPSEAIASLLGRSSTTKYEEEQVLQAVVSWLEHDWITRKTHATSVLTKVRLGVIPQEILRQYLDKDQFKESPELKELLTDVLLPDGASANPGMASGSQTSDMYASRGTITALVATGGTKIGNNGPFARYFHYSNPDTEDTAWIPLLKLPKPPGVPNIQDHTMTTLDGKLYLAGGGRHNLNSIMRSMLQSFFQYDPKVNDWKRLPNMLCGREGFVMVQLDNLIYAIGGCDEDGELTVYDETFNLEDQSWYEGDDEYVGACDPSAVVYKNKILMYGHGINDGFPSDNVYYYEDDEDGDEDERYTAALAMEEQREVRTSLHTLQMYDPAAKKWYSLMRQRHHVHTVHGDNEQYSALVIRNDKCYRVVYDKMRERHCWISKPRVNELVMELESSAPSAQVGKEEEQRWLPEYHVPGAFCIEGEIYVNVNGCIVNTGQQMPKEKPTIDRVNFSRWLGVDSPEMANSAVTMYTFDHYNLTL
ncbi:kelch-like protein 25 [Amphiura filiformis]|uniref:kelch-like protein 25 n=1 Tax=Amphiura filiformis TaxID=82378 RepID=UPI003B21EDC1